MGPVPGSGFLEGMPDLTCSLNLDDVRPGLGGRRRCRRRRPRLRGRTRSLLAPGGPAARRGRLGGHGLHPQGGLRVRGLPHAARRRRRLEALPGARILRLRHRALQRSRGCLPRHRGAGDGVRVPPGVGERRVRREPVRVHTGLRRRHGRRRRGLPVQDHGAGGGGRAGPPAHLPAQAHRRPGRQRPAREPQLRGRLGRFRPRGSRRNRRPLDAGEAVHRRPAGLPAAR